MDCYVLGKLSQSSFELRQDCGKYQIVMAKLHVGLVEPIEVESIGKMIYLLVMNKILASMKPEQFEKFWTKIALENSIRQRPSTQPPQSQQRPPKIKAGPINMDDLMSKLSIKEKRRRHSISNTLFSENSFQMNITEAIAPPISTESLDEELPNQIISSLFTPPMLSKPVQQKKQIKMLSCFMVQFTSGRTDTFHAQCQIKVGDYVVVEADRGEDLGRVIMDQINVPLQRRNSNSSSETMPKRIYRVASVSEIEQLQIKVRDEQHAINVAQYKVSEWKLPMAICDAEYQYDRRKLTFFFTVTIPQVYPNQPAPRIDFRTLVRDLYQIYRTRIWLFCVDKEQGCRNSSHHREKFLKQLLIDLKPEYQSGKSTPEEQWTIPELQGTSLSSSFGLFTDDSKWTPKC